MNRQKEKQLRNYIITGTVIFMLSVLAIYVTNAEALFCGKTCKAELAKEAKKKVQTEILTSDLKLISITRSQTCVRIDCVSLEYLAKNFDTSDVQISGDFKTVNGKWERQNPPYKESAKLYHTSLAKPHNGTIVFVEPDMYTMARSKQIIIETSLKSYLVKADKKIQLDYQTDIRKQYNFVWLDSCSIARIGWAENGAGNLPKLIEYMKNNCNGTLDIKNMTEQIITKKTSLLGFCGQDCQHKKFMEEAKKKSKQNLLNEKMQIKNSKMKLERQTTKS